MDRDRELDRRTYRGRNPGSKHRGSDDDSEHYKEIQAGCCASSEPVVKEEPAAEEKVEEQAAEEPTEEVKEEKPVEKPKRRGRKPKKEEVA